MATSTQGKPRIVIIGCGFGGLEAARALKDAPVEITLVRSVGSASLIFSAWPTAGAW